MLSLRHDQEIPAGLSIWPSVQIVRDPEGESAGRSRECSRRCACIRMPTGWCSPATCRASTSATLAHLDFLEAGRTKRFSPTAASSTACPNRCARSMRPPRCRSWNKRRQTEFRCPRKVLIRARLPPAGTGDPARARQRQHAGGLANRHHAMNTYQISLLRPARRAPRPGRRNGHQPAATTPPNSMRQLGSRALVRHDLRAFARRRQ